MKKGTKLTTAILLGAGSVLSYLAAKRILNKNKEEELIEIPFEVEEEAE